MDSPTVQSLNIDLSNAAMCILSCSSAFVKKDLPSSQGFFQERIKVTEKVPFIISCFFL